AFSLRLCGCFSSAAAMTPGKSTARSKAAGNRRAERTGEGEEKGVTGESFVVKSENDRDLHAGVHSAAVFATRLELPLADGLNRIGLELPLGRFYREGLHHVAVGIDDEFDGDFARDARATHF